MARGGLSGCCRLGCVEGTISAGRKNVRKMVSDLGIATQPINLTHGLVFLHAFGTK